MISSRCYSSKDVSNMLSRCTGSEYFRTEERGANLGFLQHYVLNVFKTNVIPAEKNWLSWIGDFVINFAFFGLNRTANKCTKIYKQ